MKLSPLIIGTMRLGAWGVQMNEKSLHGFIESCLALGQSSFDHADIYGHYTTEEDFGVVLKGNSSLRDRLQLITKCGIGLLSENRPENRIKHYNSTKEYIIQSVDNSLKALNTDRIDLLLIHRPDFLMDPDEVGITIDQLKLDGKVLEFGVSNFSFSQFQMLNSRIKLFTNQIEVHPLHLDAFTNGTLDQCLENGIQPMAWSPLGGGRIFGNEDPVSKKVLTCLKELSDKYDAAPDQLIYAWLLKHPSTILPIIGTTKISRVETAVKALKINMDQQDWYKIWTAATGQEVA